MSDLWPLVYHEVGHSIAAWAVRSQLSRLRIGLKGERCDMGYTLQLEPVERFYLAKALIIVSGVVAEREYGGVARELKHCTGTFNGLLADGEAFQQAVARTDLLKDWPLEDAERALGAMSKDVLAANERQLHALAQRLMDRRYLWGPEAHELLNYWSKAFGVVRGSLMQADWQTATTRALQQYRPAGKG